MANEGKEFSGRVSGVLSILIALGSVWIVVSTASSSSGWNFSVLACFVPILFAVQGIRLSREPGAVWPRFSLITSIVGIAIGVVAFVGYLFLLSR